MSYRPLLLNGLANALKQHLDTSQKKNQNYSLRAFARDIQISPSTISKIMNEKYVVSDKLLNEIVEYLNLEIAVKRQIIFIERYSIALNPDVRGWQNRNVINKFRPCIANAKFKFIVALGINIHLQRVKI